MAVCVFIYRLKNGANYANMVNFEVLDVMVDDIDDDGCIRIKCENNIIKYIIINENTFGYMVPPARSTIASQIPELPSGEWTMIRLKRVEINGRLQFDAPERVELASVENLWCPLKVDLFDLELKPISINVFEVKMRQGKASPSPNLPSTMIAKICAYPQRMHLWNRENETYLKLRDKGIAPDLLGYVTENNGMGAPRVVGLLLQKIDGHHALSLSDLSICVTTLWKFYAATGCVHGDANQGNFIIKPDGSKAFIIDFPFLIKASKKRMQNEIETLKKVMKEDDERKKIIGEKEFFIEELREQISNVKPITEEEDQRREKIGINTWVEEQITNILEGKSKYLYKLPQYK